MMRPRSPSVLRPADVKPGVTSEGWRSALGGKKDLKSLDAWLACGGTRGAVRLRASRGRSEPYRPLRLTSPCSVGQRCLDGGTGARRITAAGCLPKRRPHT